MTEAEIKKIKDIIDNNDDIKKCKYYYSEINKGNYNYINDALVFTNQKYNELCITDTDLVIEKKIVSISNPVDKNIVSRTLGNLSCINDLLVAKIIKELINK